MLISLFKILVVLLVTAAAAYRPVTMFLRYLNDLRVYENRRYGREEAGEAPVLPRLWPGIVATVATFVAAVVLLNTFAIVPGGHRGVVFSQATGVEKRVLPEGLSFVMPVVETVHLIDVRTNSVTFQLDKANPAASSDGQDVYMKVTVSYHPLPEKVNLLWQEVGDRDEFENKILGREVLQVTKAVIPSHQAQDIFAKREEIRSKTMAQLNERTTISGYIVITSVSIENVDFKKEFRELLEQKAQRTQALEIAKKDVDIAEQAKLKKIKESEATMTSTKNVADGMAYQNKVLAKSVTEKSLDARKLEIAEIMANKWNGGYPQYWVNMGGGSSNGTLPIFDLNAFLTQFQAQASQSK